MSIFLLQIFSSEVGGKLNKENNIWCYLFPLYILLLWHLWVGLDPRLIRGIAEEVQELRSSRFEWYFPLGNLGTICCKCWVQLMWLEAALNPFTLHEPPSHQSAHMGHGAKSSTTTSWALLTVLVVARGKPLEEVNLHVYAENLQHCRFDCS